MESGVKIEDPISFELDQKGMRYIFSCTAEMKKCCEKYKKGKRCKKCPKR